MNESAVVTELSAALAAVNVAVADKNDQPTGAKKRKRRAASSYLALRAAVAGYDELDAGNQMQIVASGTSIKACLKAVADSKSTGDIAVVCVRRRVTVSVEETVTIK